jgi:hypothetical protein
MRRLCFFLFVLLMAMGSVALADGAYIPLRAVEKPPAIPMQTALVCHQDGIETLVVESSARAAEGDAFAWVLPLPSSPQSIEQVSPAMLSTLRSVVTKEIKADPPTGPFCALVFLVISSLFVSAAVAEHGKEKKIWAPKLLEYLIVVIIIAVLSAIAVPNFLGAGVKLGTDVPGIAELQRSDVGSYDVAVLRADDPEALPQWLAQNGFAAIPQKALPVVRSYAQEGWVFVVSQLRRNGSASELLTPHPLKLVFPTEAPVYPMRLTALAGSVTDVALFTAGTQPYAHPLFRTEYAQKMADYATKRPDLLNGGDVEFMGTWDPNDRFVRLQNRDLAELVRPGMWLTRLQATLRPDQMEKDIVLEPARMIPSREVVYTRATASANAWALSLGLFFIFLPLLTYFTRRNRKRLRLAFSAWLIMLAGAALPGLFYFYHTPKIREYTVSSRMPGDHAYRHLVDEFQSPGSSTAAELRKSASPTEDQFRAAVKSYFERRRIKIAEAPVPGGFFFSRENERLLIHVVDEFGYEYVIESGELLREKSPKS